MIVLPLHRSAEDLVGISVLRALVDVARRCGVDTTIEHLQRSYALSGSGIETRQLIAMARDLGLEARSLTVKWSELPKLHKSLPAILRLDDGAALVLEAVRDDPAVGRVVVAHDPTAAPDAMVVLDEAHLSRVWKGEIVLVKRRYGVTDEAQPFGLAWLIGQALRERRLFIEIGAAAVVNTVFVIAPPLIFIAVLNRALSNHSMSTLKVVAVALLVMIFFETTLGFLKRHFTEIATTRIDGRLNLYVMDKLLKLPIDYFERNPTGLIMSKLNRMWQIRNFLTGQLFGTFLNMVPLIALVPLLLVINWRLSLYVFALTIIIFLITLAFIRPTARRFAKVVRTERAKSTHLIETITGMRTIKCLALEGRRRREWDILVADALSTRHEFNTFTNYPQTLTRPFQRLVYIGSFTLGAFIIITSPETMMPGSLVGFAMLAMRMAQPLMQLAKLMQDLSEVRGALSEVASIMNAPPEQTRSGAGLRLPIEGNISFEDVRFRYASGAPFALDGVSFHIPQGTMFGIMGRSGSGKTTVTRLLQGLHPQYEGIIKIDGMDLREIDLTHLRTSIGVVPQENFLFSGTIRENIAIAKPSATFSEVVRAAQLAGAEEFIERLPRGYDTPLEEGAVNLSGGQRQRLAIARALLIDPAVLILDEATSALDAESEAIINANLQRIAHGRTIICISHRLSMLVPADAILVLERGRVYDIGRHEELLHRCDIYKHLWHQQNRNSDRGAAHAQITVARSPHP